MTYSELKPTAVFKYFAEISQIPRGSGNEQAISDYLVGFAKNRNLSVMQDEHNNVIIKKDATDGYENSKKIILQGHMDMVPEKGSTSTHDFLKDPIELIVDGDILHANDTTLGADNGIAVAMSLAILDSDNLEHGPIEVLITTSEETDLGGAQALSDKVLEGDYLINIDSEEEGIITAGSAGGELYTAYFPPRLEEVEHSYTAYNIEFSGFMGGHSGVEIGSPKGNMIVVMADFIDQLDQPMLINFDAGTKDNAIPRMGKMSICVKNDNCNCEHSKMHKINHSIDDVINKLKEKYQHIEGELKISYSKMDTPNKAQAIPCTKEFAEYILQLPTGVITYTDDTKKFVASSSNLAIIKKEEDGRYKIENSIRFNKTEYMADLEKIFTDVSKKHELEYGFSSYYPEWEYKEDSQLRDIAMKVYKKMYNEDMKMDIIHAGLECGVFYIKYRHLDMISIGPDINDPHTPQESLSIISTQRVYEYLIELLKALK